MATIAVFSGEYCSSETIVETVADVLGYTVVNREIAQTAAQKFNLSERKVSRALTGSRGLFNALTHEWEKNLIHLSATMAEMLKNDDQIFVGPAIHLIPQPITHVLRVRITADRETRVKRAIEKENLTNEEAQERITKNDQEIKSWTNQILSYVPWDPLFYDLSLSVPSTSVEKATELICEAARKETLRPTETSKQFVEDFAVASSVSAALLEKGKLVCDVTAHQGKVTVIVDPGSPSKGAIARTMQSLRYENIEEKVHEICSTMEDVTGVEIRPGPSVTRSSQIPEAPSGQRQKVPSVDSKSEGDEEKPSDRGPLRILLVDDDIELVDHLGKRLKSRGFPVDVVSSGEAAIQTSEEKTFDVAVVDINMPGTNGIETLRRLKQIQPMIQVIMLTGYGNIESAFESGKLDAVSFLHKPHPFERLLEDIQTAGERKFRAQRSAYERELSALITYERDSQDISSAKSRLKEKYEQ